MAAWPLFPAWFVRAESETLSVSGPKLWCRGERRWCGCRWCRDQRTMRDVHVPWSISGPRPVLSAVTLGVAEIDDSIEKSTGSIKRLSWCTDHHVTGGYYWLLAFLQAEGSGLRPYPGSAVSGGGDLDVVQRDRPPERKRRIRSLDWSLWRHYPRWSC